jgi:hypothetical protein
LVFGLGFGSDGSDVDVVGWLDWDGDDDGNLLGNGSGVRWEGRDDGSGGYVDRGPPCFRGDWRDDFDVRRVQDSFFPVLGDVSGDVGDARR